MRPPDRLWRWTSVPVRLAPLLFFAFAWQALSALQWIDPAFLPKPTVILAALADLLAGGEIRDNLLVSLFRAATGLVLGAASGVAIGLMMARSPTFRAYATPIIGGTYSLPKSALIPLFILWFGIGTTTAVCAVYLACLLPMIVHTYHGVAATPKVLVWSAQSLGATRRELVSRIYLRHALPDILTGLRIALGFSFVLAISSEMIASTSGIGKLIFMYGENGAYDYMLAAISCIVIVAFVADRLMLLVTAVCLRWHESANKREAA
jgi:ABC-type nitrate/sulfonate/bicarbonate transport system permease component